MSLTKLNDISELCTFDIYVPFAFLDADQLTQYWGQLGQMLNVEITEFGTLEWVVYANEDTTIFFYTMRLPFNHQLVLVLCLLF